MKHYETELPSGYEAVYRINAKEKKTGLWMNGIGLVLFVLTFLPFALTFDFASLFDGERELTDVLLPFYLVFLIGYVAYIILHELTHGAAYKLLTHQKLTFGLTWSAAFCGVPDIYVYRTASLISILAPFVVFTTILSILLTAFRSNPGVYMGLVLLLCGHIAGCVGDLYGAALMLFRFRDPNMLMRDTGPEQTFYLLKNE